MRAINLLSSFYQSLSVSYRKAAISSRTMSTRSYADAVEKLNSLQSNAATLEAVRASGGRLSEFAIPEMIEYLESIGYTTEQLNKLHVIHITGTKGKGSTSAFTDSIIRHAMPTWKVGLYTSPHLVAVRERIRINGSPISEDEFTKFFYEVWDKLKANDTRKMQSTSPMPGYFRFITLLAFHAFLELKVDATILEVGVGGTYDSTNIVPKPVVTGVTALGIDHVSVLGKTLQEIAWQKGGIFKSNVPAFTVQQPPEAMDVLAQRAQELKRKASEFKVCSLTPGIDKIKLGIAGAHQRQNATLAIHLVWSFLRSKGEFSEQISFPDQLPKSFIEGLKSTKWPGRCQSVADPRRHNTIWYLDGAHTIESLESCMQWFVDRGVGLSSNTSSSDSAKPIRVLIFNCTSGRSGHSFLGVMKENIATQLQLYEQAEDPNSFFDHVIFCTNVTYADGHFKGDLTTKAIPEADLTELKTQQQLASAWASLVPSFPVSNIHTLPSIEHAVKEVEKIGLDNSKPLKVLVTGSLHLVGGLIEVAGLSDVAL